MEDTPSPDYSDPTNPREEARPSHEARDFFVVGIGASAGGLEALEQFFANMPAGNGMAFVVIQHLSPTHKSLMVDLLGKHTRMPVQHVAQDTRLHPDHIYLIPPGANLKIRDGQLRLEEQDRAAGPNFPIDIFFDSMAEAWGDRAIGIILSGTGSDGTRGARSIKERGGLVLVQTPDSARFEGMPQSAIGTSLVDRIVPPNGMPRVLLGYIRHPRLFGVVEALEARDEEAASLKRILADIHAYAGVNFERYKPSTIRRRIEHRMGLNQITSLGAYARFLEETGTEIRLLYKEMLIGVTRFFRDREAFEWFDRQAIPQLIARARERSDQSLRVWVAGCSTGEEAYSIAILLSHHLRQIKDPVEVKIFATDIDQEALSRAALGYYPASITADVPAPYLSRYFIKQGEHYQVAHELRQRVIFAPHNVLKDVPFSKLDVISCRNLLIYFTPETQARVLQNFAYALNEDGVLFLGNSEHIAGGETYFVTVDKRLKFYRNRGVVSQPAADLDPHGTMNWNARRKVGGFEVPAPFVAANERYHRVLAGYMPPSVVVDTRYRVLYFFGNTNRYLRMPVGPAHLNLLNIVHKDLRVLLGTALHRVLQEKRKIMYHRVPFQEDDREVRFDLIVDPLMTGDDIESIVVVFSEVSSGDPGPAGPDYSIPDYSIEEQTQQRINDLERKVEFTQESLHVAIEELETSNEELQATNEELMASNQELQRTNEDLQSINEELTTVNGELQAKIGELIELNADVYSLLQSTNISTIFLDDALQIRKYTNQAQEHVHLQPSDVGRPFYHLQHNFTGIDLNALAQQVVDTNASFEQEVRSKTGSWFLMRLHPYVTFDEDEPEGVVITFIDVTDLHDASERLKAEIREREQAEARMRHYADGLKRSNQELDDLVYIASHDLKAPLRAIDHLIHAIDAESAGLLPKKAQRDMEVTLRRVAHMQSLLDDLLEYSRVGRMLSEPEEVDTRALAEEAVQAAGLPEGCAVEWTGAFPTLQTVRTPLLRVLVELIKNAVGHHTNPSGGRIEISAETEGRHAVFQVRDDGPGIPAGSQGDVFRMFRSLQPKEEGRGNGVGLALVKKTLDHQGGTIVLESAEGQGTSVRFTWPNAPLGAPSRRTETHPVNGAGR